LTYNSVDLLGIGDITDRVTLCDDLTGRWPLHMGNAVISKIFRPLVGLPFPLCMPHRGPRSFLKKLYIQKDLYFYYLLVCYSSATAVASSSLCLPSPHSPRAL
jgi:hypothetical protein